MAGATPGTTNISIDADCNVVAGLLACLTDGVSCNALTYGNFGYTLTGPPTYYSSVFMLLAPKYVVGLSRYVYMALGAFTAYSPPSATGVCTVSAECGQGYICAGHGQCVRASVHYHDAVDVDLAFDYTAFVWRRAANARADSPALLWTESNWAADIGTRIYRQEAPGMAWVLLAWGLVLSMGTALGTHYARQFCRKHLKLA